MIANASHVSGIAEGIWIMMSHQTIITVFCGTCVENVCTGRMKISSAPFASIGSSAVEQSINQQTCVFLVIGTQQGGQKTTSKQMVSKSEFVECATRSAFHDTCIHNLCSIQNGHSANQTPQQWLVC